MGLTIDTKSAADSELAVKALLERLLDRYDISRWIFTDRVVIEDGAIAHSHPVLTLGTRFIVRTPLGVLSMLLHEQMHWYLVEREAACDAAIAELRASYPLVPSYDEGGARDELSTYLHLVVNWLELEVLKLAAGASEGEATVRAAVDGPVYGWVYRQIFDDHERIGDIVRRHGLDSVLTS